jgi:hypothetical protein
VDLVIAYTVNIDSVSLMNIVSKANIIAKSQCYVYIKNNGSNEF